jgi:putative transcriptional regulator
VDSLQGRLLVAGPTLTDPHFERSVVLLGEHGPEGAMGVVLNRPSIVLVADAATPLGSLTAPDDVVFVGGPVEPQAIVVLADFADPARAGALVLDSIGFLPSVTDPDDELGELRACRVFAGYAGWAPGQLEAELEDGAWIIAETDPTDVFADEPERLWQRVLRRQGGSTSLLALYPDDPRLN